MSAATAGCPPHEWMCLTGGAIGQGLPVATGAAIAAPGRRVLSLEADGSAMYTLQSWWTQARESLDVTTVILENHSYAILEMELSRVGAEAAGPDSQGDARARPPTARLRVARTRHGRAGRACHRHEELTSMLARSFTEARTVCDRGGRRQGNRLTSLTIAAEQVTRTTRALQAGTTRDPRRRDAAVSPSASDTTPSSTRSS